MQTGFMFWKKADSRKLGSHYELLDEKGLVLCLCGDSRLEKENLLAHKIVNSV
jgi:hypothetical protein